MKGLRIDFGRKGSGQCMARDCAAPSAIPVTTGAERLELCVAHAWDAMGRTVDTGCPLCGAKDVPHACVPALEVRP